jgi:hypothetical protein
LDLDVHAKQISDMVTTKYPKLRPYKSFLAIFEMYNIAVQHMSALLKYRIASFKVEFFMDKKLDREVLDDWITFMKKNNYRFPWGAFTTETDSMIAIVEAWWSRITETKKPVDLCVILTRSGLTRHPVSGLDQEEYERKKQVTKQVIKEVKPKTIFKHEERRNE